MPPISETQKRVIQEKSDLEDKYGRLWAFTKSTKFRELDEESKLLLLTQLNIMDAYINILQLRIKNWKEEQ